MTTCADRWMVVMTSQPPTPSLRVLAGGWGNKLGWGEWEGDVGGAGWWDGAGMSGWQLVVVGDKNTPEVGWGQGGGWVY